MRYTNGADWVEFKPGLGRQSMSRVLAASSAPSSIAEWITACRFDNASGGEPLAVTVTDGATLSGQMLLDGLTFQQWDWLSNQFITWARDDKLDPEL